MTFQECDKIDSFSVSLHNDSICCKQPKYRGVDCTNIMKFLTRVNIVDSTKPIYLLFTDQNAI